MKITFNTAVKAGLLAVALAFAGSSHADTGSAETYKLKDFTDVPNGQSVVLYDGVSFEQDYGQVVLPTFTAQSSLAMSDGSHYSMLVFCLEPNAPTLPNASYTLGSVTLSLPVLANVNKLFSVGYADITSSAGVVNAQKFTSFQLALWELTNDANKVTGLGGDMYNAFNNDPGKGQAFVYSSDPYEAATVVAAQALLTAVYDSHVQGGPSYNLYQLTNADGSQTMLAAPVPEADTWAMLAAGLGLLGLVSRRKNRKNEKFV